MSGLIALAAAYVLSQFYRSFLAVLTPQLTQDLGADKGDLSQAAGIWFISFALMQFVVGVALDRYGPRRTASWIFGAGTVSGALIFATAQSPAAIVLAMCLFGIGCSPVLMASLYIFAQRYSAATFAIMTSWLVAFGNTGNVIGASPLAVAVDQFGWRMVMLALGAASLLIALLVNWLVNDPVTQAISPATKQGEGQTSGQSSGQIPGDTGLNGYLVLLKSRVLWAIMTMTLLCYAPVAGIRGLWAGPYLSDIYQADGLQIGKATLFMALAMIMGSLAYGPLDRWFNTRKWVVFCGNLIVLVSLLVLVSNPVSTLSAATWLFVIIGLCGTSYGVLMAHGRHFLPPHLIGRGVTLLNFCSIFGAGAMQFITGRVVQSRSEPASVASYQLLFAVYAGVLAVALFIYLFSKDAPPN